MAPMPMSRLVLGLLVAGALAPAVAPAAKAPAKPATTRGAGRSHASVLPWIDDDHPRAMAEAKARKTPIFVESWAPW